MRVEGRKMLCGTKIPFAKLYTSQFGCIHVRYIFLALCCFPQLGIPLLTAQSDFDFYQKPIQYQTAKDDNTITRLKQAMQDGDVKLAFHPTRGYLDSILSALQIPVNSQALVFSKTSLQLRPINPTTPRALYFNDSVYVGWVPGGDRLEFIASDPTLGSVFYSLPQTAASARLVRDKGECLQCHANRRTHEVPGPLVRSLYTSASGQPVYNFGNFLSDHSSPLHERWGGYYVTGTHGKMLHMGNMFVSRDDDVDNIDFSQGANRLSLPRNVNEKLYPTKTSDIVALMVLEHQTQMQNLLSKAIYEERRAEHYDAVFGLNQNGGSDFTKRRIQRVVTELVDYLFFVDEFALTSPITGTSMFARDFSKREPQTKSGQSLYQFDLNTRMFKHPLSYMVYTDTFKALGPKTTAALHRQINQILTGSISTTNESRFNHLTPEIRASIRQILTETHPELGKLFSN